MVIAILSIWVILIIVKTSFKAFVSGGQKEVYVIRVTKRHGNFTKSVYAI